MHEGNRNTAQAFIIGLLQVLASDGEIKRRDNFAISTQSLRHFLHIGI